MTIAVIHSYVPRGGGSHHLVRRFAGYEWWVSLASTSSTRYGMHKPHGEIAQRRCPVASDDEPRGHR
jgi:hypothetical protein